MWLVNDPDATLEVKKQSLHSVNHGACFWWLLSLSMHGKLINV